MLSHTVRRLLQIKQLQQIVVVVDHANAEKARTVETLNKDKITVCIGGASRTESVKNGLLQLPANAQVLVHDAARPCVRIADIYRLITEVGDSADGGILAMRVTDTLKRADADLCIAETIDRNAVWRAATPQLFMVNRLLAAIDSALEANKSITDEASAMQRTGCKPKLVECASDNIKITTTTDLVMAQYYLEAQQRQHNHNGNQ